ncbi:MAG: GlsB/YeaQ/YmgE family stress response membrane protein [Nostoc sp.]|uniref:GlsB/YeaQ/YmgE family stress response membrane protein n=1 Tax=Nostoc sp. TaxID=1180 RepID=UPI002FFC206F
MNPCTTSFCKQLHQRSLNAIVKAIYPGHQGGGIIGTILLGIIGAFVGGNLGVFFSTRTLTLTATSFTIPGIAVAVLGAIVAVFL